ncbi:MAG: antibiotic biosynthesis monooxygenase [Methanosphaera sp.]|nr:antibiotic biosynthesis monooxygenase [Methanosphaera sp.]
MIIVNAKLNPKDNKTDEIIKLANKLIRLSREHEGNISYDLYQNTQNSELIFVEKWQSTELLQKHMKTDEFLEFGQNTKELIIGEMDITLSYEEILSSNKSL